MHFYCQIAFVLMCGKQNHMLCVPNLGVNSWICAGNNRSLSLVLLALWMEAELQWAYLTLGAYVSLVAAV